MLLLSQIVNTDSIIQASSLPGNTKAVAAPDFDQIEKVSFPPKGSSDEGPYPTPSHDLAHTFTFKSYAPQVFHRLRSYFDIPVAAYMESICGEEKRLMSFIPHPPLLYRCHYIATYLSTYHCYLQYIATYLLTPIYAILCCRSSSMQYNIGNYNYVEFISNSKSGQFFFYSHDGRYLLKTQTKEENKFLLDVLPEYYQYLHDNPHSLLCRILGMHRIEMYHLRRKVHFVVMTSVFDTPNKIERMYDLKGSLVGRNASQEDRDQGCGVWKDNDLLADKGR
jgi:1-phosphatidylinositol-4-phosphate 5-kinase